jgi:hypothetical protein
MLRRVNDHASLVIRLASALVLGLLTSVIAPRDAAACSCMRPTFEDARSSSAAIFEGRVDEIAPVAGADEVRVRFHVTQAWRGVEHESVEIQTASNSAACGFPFEAGQHYLVYAGDREGMLMVSLCSRTARMDDASEDRQLLGSGTIPVDVVDETDEPTPREPPATRAGCASCGVASAPAPTALLMVSLASLLALVARRARR